MEARPRRTFSKSERICLKRSFDYLFERGASFKIGALKFFFVFNLPPDLRTAPLSVAFAVPKRAFKRAVHRNLLKRRMREAFRCNKHQLLSVLQQRDQSLAVLVKYVANVPMDFAIIEKNFQAAFSQLIQYSAHVQNTAHRDD